MRLYGISPADVDAVALQPVLRSVDERGNWRLVGFGSGDRAIIVVVAHDDFDFVITTFPGS
jgi:hypothetical protein